MAPSDEITGHQHPLKTLTRALWHVIIAMTGAYGTSLTLFFLLRGGIGEQLNFVALLNNLVHLMLLPALVLLPLVLIFRRWILVITLVVPFIIVTLDTLPLITNQSAIAATDATEIRLLSYNLLARSGNFEETISLIREADADIIALQEVGFPVVEAIQRELDDLYPQMALHPQTIATTGQGILSRYPIIENEYWRNDLPVQLGHQRVQIDINGTAIVIYNVHLVHPGMTGLDVSIRSNDLNMLLARALLDEATYPTLLMGDFNMTDKTEDYAHISATFTDTHKTVGRGLGYTFPDTRYSNLFSLSPLLARLDYVFYDTDWQGLSTRVWEYSGGSDHRPLFVELALTSQ